MSQPLYVSRLTHRCLDALLALPTLTKKMKKMRKSGQELVVDHYDADKVDGVKTLKINRVI